MSEVAGRLAVIEGRLTKANAGGRGILISGVPGTAPAEVVVIGGGVVGECGKNAIGLARALQYLIVCHVYAICRIFLVTASPRYSTMLYWQR